MFVLKARRRGGDLIAFGPGGRALAVRSETGLQLWRGDLSPDAKPTVFRDIDSVGHLQFSPDGASLYVDGWNTCVIDVVSGEDTPFPEPKGFRYFALTAAGDALVVVNQPPLDRTTIESWPVDRPFQGKPTWRVKLPQPHGGRPMPLPDGRFVNIVLAKGREYSITVRSGATGELLAESPPIGWSPDREAVSPDGQWLAGVRENKMGVWSLADLAAPPLEWRNDSRRNFTDLAFHPSGRFLAVTSNDTTVRLYDTATWGVAKTFAWDVGKLVGVAFTPDGTLAAAGSDAGRVVVWDVDV